MTPLRTISTLPPFEIKRFRQRIGTAISELGPDYTLIDIVGPKVDGFDVQLRVSWRPVASEPRRYPSKVLTVHVNWGYNVRQIKRLLTVTAKIEMSHAS